MEESEEKTVEREEPEARERYPHFLSVPTRWMDNDVYGHVNNVVYYSYFDTVVNEYLIHSGVLDIEKSPVIGLVVETQCRFFESLTFPDTVHAGLRVARLGGYTARDQSTHLLEQGFVFFCKGSDGIRVDVELADYLALIPDQDHQLGAGVDRTRQVVLDLAHVIDDLVAVLGDGRAADALPDTDARVVHRRRAGTEHEGVPHKQIDAAPVPHRMRFVHPPHNLVQYLLIRRVRGHEHPHRGSQVLTKPCLLTHRWSPSVNGTSPLNNNAAQERNP